jgi:hypothetical protein
MSTLFHEFSNATTTREVRPLENILKDGKLIGYPSG